MYVIIWLKSNTKCKLLGRSVVSDKNTITNSVFTSKQEKWEAGGCIDLLKNIK